MPPPSDGGGSSRLDEDAGRLLDYLIDHEEGLTYEDANTVWGWRKRYFQMVVQYYRMLFANDPRPLISDKNPEDKRGPWIFKLSHDPRAWEAHRTIAIESQIETVEYIARSALKGLDGRTVLGKRERIFHRYFSRLVEDIAELREQAM